MFESIVDFGENIVLAECMVDLFVRIVNIAILKSCQTHHQVVCVHAYMCVLIYVCVCGL